jgi:hypothetical protein
MAAVVQLGPTSEGASRDARLKTLGIRRTWIGTRGDRTVGPVLSEVCRQSGYSKGSKGTTTYVARLRVHNTTKRAYLDGLLKAAHLGLREAARLWRLR